MTERTFQTVSHHVVEQCCRALVTGSPTVVGVDGARRQDMVSGQVLKIERTGADRWAVTIKEATET